MSEYKRLTKQAGWHKDIDLTDELGYSYIYQRLAELENKIEQGTLIELPCKVGDTIYWTSSNNRDIIEVVVNKISFTKYDRVILLVEEKGAGEYSIPLVWDIYLTREEAEKQLKQ